MWNDLEKIESANLPNEITNKNIPNNEEENEENEEMKKMKKMKKMKIVIQKYQMNLV